MAYTWYKAAADEGGAKGSEISSGTVNALFPTLTTQERINGDDKKRKVYLESDTALTVYVGPATTGDYNACLFASAGDSEVVGDLTGSEDRYGAARVVSATTTSIVVEDNADWQFFRAGEYIISGGDIAQIDTVTDEGDGTHTVALVSELGAAPAADDYITSALQLTLAAETAVPFWRENKVAAGSSKVNEYNTVQILVVD
jgi:hypothetical protein